MPIYERDVLLHTNDALGNVVIEYIITRALNVLLMNDLAELLGTESATVDDALRVLYNKLTAHDVADGSHADIRELVAQARSIAEGRSRGVSFTNYSALVTALNAAATEDYAVGDNFFVQTADVPDLWVYGVASASTAYTYTNDATLVAALDVGPVQIGYYLVAKLEIGKVDVSGEIATHNSSGTAHADIRKLIADLSNAAVKSLADLGITATAAELNYVDGVTSPIQTQLNGKAEDSHNHSATNINSGTLDVVRGGTGQASLADTVYATPRYRASALVAVETTPTINGAVNWRYE